MSSEQRDQKPSFNVMREKFLQGDSTPSEYLEGCIEAIERAEHSIKAFTYIDVELAREQAEASTKRYGNHRPLSAIDGMPIGIKDIIDTADMPTRMNSPIYDTYAPKIDAPAVKAALAGGAVTLGKTVTTEFAIGVPGPTTNPRNIGHTPGGSSSGSAAGAAAGMFAAGFATQTNGSILRPASFCGVVGYKPTIDMLSTEGIHPLSRTNDHLGVIARSVSDTWLLARWVSEKAPQKGRCGLAGPATGDVPATRPDRLAILRTHGFSELDRASMEVFEAHLEQFRNEGINIVESAKNAKLRSLINDLDEIRDCSFEVVSYEMQTRFAQYAERYPEKLSDDILELVAQGSKITRDRYCEKLQFRDCLRRKFAALADDFDAFLLPSSSGPAPEGLNYTGSRTLLLYASFSGLPAFSIPVMEVDNMPFGLQVIGHAGGDYRLARFAQWLHQMCV